MFTGYVINGVWAEYLDRDGNTYYRCDECGNKEAEGHDKKCSYYYKNKQL